ncbi:GFA family protein [Rhizobium sp. RU36D]|uniref:GFA family protein n=1 Tax=Rhizobium sp. RU36D TaxID=1907415 RepID=UPI0009D7DA3B|nr:GFA family protein [Rhizobium sp. RU36D]SMC82529.1 Uncharacterized conserved protein [Rhizobium sp. RU36D]
MNDVASIREGACRCGQLRLKAHGAPLITMACHCEGCRKMTASAFSLSALYPQDAVEVSGLEPVIGGMHSELHHYFCPYCLSWVFTRAEMMGPFVNVRATMLDGADDLAPFIETCVAEKLSWVTTPAVHSFEVFPPMERFPELMAQYATSRQA